MITHNANGNLLGDRTIPHWFAAQRTPTLNHWSLIVSNLGATQDILIVSVVTCAVFLAVTRRWRPVVFVAVVMLGELAAFLTIAAIARRPRPDVPRLLKVLFPGYVRHAEQLVAGPDAYDTYGFRVPAVIVSPYARPDCVLSDVFDHTSVLKLVEEKHPVGAPGRAPDRERCSGVLRVSAGPRVAWLTASSDCWVASAPLFFGAGGRIGGHHPVGA